MMSYKLLCGTAEDEVIGGFDEDYFYSSDLSAGTFVDET